MSRQCDCFEYVTQVLFNIDIFSQFLLWDKAELQYFRYNYLQSYQSRNEGFSAHSSWSLLRIRSHQKYAPSTRIDYINFQKFAFAFHWKRNESIASRRSFSNRFSRPHENDTSDWKRLPINLTLRMSRKLSCFQCRPSWIFSNKNALGLGLRSHDQSLSKVCIFSEFDPSTRPRYCCVFKSFHSGERFQNLRFHRKRNIISIVFVWSGDKRVDTAWKLRENLKCLHFVR